MYLMILGKHVLRGGGEMYNLWKVKGALVLFGIILSIDALYQTWTTAQAFIFPQALFPVNLWQLTIINVLVFAGIAFLVHPRNTTK